uniref:Uncharacterized protein n=1 Tax=Rhizophora mucronata TaxID=61149 RepID=A0A2P2PSF4_RHIMU
MQVLFLALQKLLFKSMIEAAYQ